MNYKIHKIFSIFLCLSILFLPKTILAKEVKKPIKVLIVPGHDDESYGTEFGGIKEADMTVKLGLMIFETLKKDKNFKVYITRDWNGYTKEFSDLFTGQKSEIADFINFARTIQNEKEKQGDAWSIDGVYHNDAPAEVAYKLYGINFWANQNDVDAVIHIHFNDYPRSDQSKRGKYKGFTIYTPDKQLKNGNITSSLSFFLLNSLLKNYNTSTYKKELSGIVPSQDLIAVGSNNSLNTRSLLVEYGYVYEEKFSTFKKREKEFKTMAKLTTEAITKYFKSIQK